MVPYKDFITSAPAYIKGPYGKMFLVHSALITHLSKPLNEAINGNMKEAHEGLVEIVAIDDDVDDGTVMRFVEFAYTGDYTVPSPLEASAENLTAGSAQGPHQEPIVRPASEISFSEPPDEEPEDELLPPNTMPEPEPIQEPEIRWDFGLNTKEKKKKRKMMEAEGIQFDAFGDPIIPEPALLTPVAPPEDEWVGKNFTWYGSNSSNFYCNHCNTKLNHEKPNLWSKFVSSATLPEVRHWEPRRPTKDNIEDYTPDLLCHARLYTFSSRYSCGPLALLAVQKLRFTLARYSPSDGVLPILNLTGYAYTHTYDPQDGCDRLRRLIIEYLMCHLGELMRSENFRQCLYNTNDLAADLMTKYWCDSD